MNGNGGLKAKDVVTWAILIWIGMEIARQQPGGGSGQIPNATDCSYGFGAQQQSSITAPFWIRNFGNNPQPFTFEAS